MFEKLSRAFKGPLSVQKTAKLSAVEAEDSSSIIKRAKNSMARDFDRLQIEFQSQEIEVSPLALPPENKEKIRTKGVSDSKKVAKRKKSKT